MSYDNTIHSNIVSIPIYYNTQHMHMHIKFNGRNDVWMFVCAPLHLRAHPMGDDAEEGNISGQNGIQN